MRKKYVTIQKKKEVIVETANNGQIVEYPVINQVEGSGGSYSWKSMACATYTRGSKRISQNNSGSPKTKHAKKIVHSQNTDRVTSVSPQLPEFPYEYRPISLCSVLYKVVAKLISNRLKCHLQHFISWSQNAFVEGRQITDNIVSAKEFLHSMKKSESKEGYFALKIDMSKAYDRVNWSFLEKMLQLLGVRGHSLQLIMNCVTSASFFILLNGASKGFFVGERVLRQGCPLSPTLFIICSQGLSLLMKKYEEEGLYQGLRINRWAPMISHLMFADDLFFFGKNDRVNVENLKRLIKQYSDWFGQQINFGKSAVAFSGGVEEWRKTTTLSDWGVREMRRNEKYLGIFPLSADSRVQSFDFLVDKFRSRLSGWRNYFLSTAGTTVLSKSVISSIPIFFFCTCLIPKTVLATIKRIQCSFWRGHEMDVKKLHFINWEKICKSKDDGGLGIRDMEKVNKSLMCKLVWRFLNDKSSMWVQLLTAKYLKGSSFWNAKDVNHSSSTWRGMLQVREYMESNVCWLINRGDEINIWDDQRVSNLLGNRLRNIGFHSTQYTMVSDLINQNARVTDIKQIITIWLQEDDGGRTFIIGSCLLWNLWKSRNDIVFNGVQFSKERCMRLSWEDFKRHHSQQFSAQQEELQDTPLMSEIWQSPPFPFVKINVDAAFRLNVGAAAAVAQDSEGRFLGGITYCFSDISPLKTEVRAFNLGISLTQQLNLEKVIVEGDAEGVASAINGPIDQVPANIKMEIMRAKESCFEFQSIVFKSVPRSTNQIAHILCKYAKDENVTRSWYTHDPPQCILPLLMI
ncbi:uncharacterized protein LOC113279629 [Papaver somniferum]|uniref:uncharacterized protein LOC113279629 n=1 Tax=Papaver somniferum TaxID=3469 RepID=UPI000E6FC687|nr:uncharacterized protein LOC113279629 [Papaver somniferum]